MGQVPRELTPSRSARDFFGAELRYWRERAGLSQARLGKVVLYSGDLIARVEKAERWPPSGMAEACDAALGTGGVLGRMWPTVEQQRRQEIEDAENRLAGPDGNGNGAGSMGASGTGGGIAGADGGGPAGAVLVRARATSRPAVWSTSPTARTPPSSTSCTAERRPGSVM